MAPLHAQQAKSPDAALARLLQGARATLPGACSQPNADRLVRILCAGRIRVGIRDYYPLFATRDRRDARGLRGRRGAARSATALGVEVEFVRVNAATRIALLAEDRIDLVIATMGHNTQRDGQVRFIRPHYYQSETTIVGPRALAVSDWKDIRRPHRLRHRGQRLERRARVAQGARLMLFDEAGVLPERLKDETCTLAAQDDSFFA